MLTQSVDELLAGATERVKFFNSDSKSGAAFERAVIDGAPYIVKYLHIDDDWIMRATGDETCRPAVAYCSGLLDELPSCIDHAIAGAATGVGRDGLGCALLMHDVGSLLVPAGDTPIPAPQHEQFLHDMAKMSAAFWGFVDGIGLAPYGNRWKAFDDNMLKREESLGWPDEVPPIVAQGWGQFFTSAAPDVARTVKELRADVMSLTNALRATPSTLLHGDWKMGNLGSHPDGRTVLLDWAVVGAGPACHDLGWYIALNRSRLPASKESSIESFREFLEANGIDTSPWWDRQLHLSLLGTVVQFGWEKALGDGDEFGWWCDRVREGERLL